MRFEQEFFVGIKDVGKENEITNYAFLSFLEETASLHSSYCGYGMKEIKTKGKAWILMDWKLEILNRAKYRDIVKVKTWARPIERFNLYTYRDFEVYLGEEKIAIASSKWVLFDINMQKIIKLSDEIFLPYEPEKVSVFKEKEISKLKEPENKELKMLYKVKRSDIDVVKHMHNLNYLNLAYEVLPEDVYLKKEKNNVRIMYKNQIVLENNVNCYYTKQDDKDIITLKNEDNTILHAIIELS